MSRISIELPGDLQAFIDSRVQSGRYADAGEYVVALLQAARSERVEIEAALVEGLNDPPAEEWTGEEFEGLKQRLLRRHR